MNAKALQVLYGVYLLVGLASMGLVVGCLLVPDFRYWLMRQGQEAHYRWAMWEYERRRAPVPDWVRRVAEERELPQEP